MRLTLRKWLETSWERARGPLYQDLEELEIIVNRMLAKVLTNDNKLNPLSIEGDNSVRPRYVANTGTNNGPKWDLVDLIDGVKRRLQFVHLVEATAPSVLIGRRSGSAGDFEQVTLGTGLSMSGTTITATAGSIAQVLAIASLRA